MDVTLQHDDRMMQPWRTAALVAVAVAAVELLVLVVIGGALIAKPSTGTATHAAKAKSSAAASTHKKAAVRHTVHRVAAPAAQSAARR